MQLIPAIDLLDGNCVRLLHGDFEKCQVYELKPSELAADYAAAGAQWLHVVDLAASRDGEESDSRPLFELLGSCSQDVQTGGGVRNAQDVQARLDAGASRVVVGSISGTQPERFTRWLNRFGAERLVAALDVRIPRSSQNGGDLESARIQTHGWTRDAGQGLWTLLSYYRSSGLRHVLCTDIGRDGAMTGPNLALYQEFCGRYPEMKVQASGGVSSLNDLRSLVATGADAAISGKALLDGAFSAEDALEALQ